MDDMYELKARSKGMMIDLVVDRIVFYGGKQWETR